MQCMNTTKSKRLRLVVVFLVSVFVLGLSSLPVAAEETSYDNYDDLGQAADELENAEKPEISRWDFDTMVTNGETLLNSVEIIEPFLKVVYMLGDFTSIQTYAFFPENKTMTDIETLALIGGLGIIGSLVLHGKAANE